MLKRRTAPKDMLILKVIQLYTKRAGIAENVIGLGQTYTTTPLLNTARGLEGMYGKRLGISKRRRTTIEPNGIGREVFEKVSEYIEGIAAGIGVASEHVYTLMVRQAVIEGIVFTAIWAVVMPVVMFIAFKFVRYVVRNWDELESRGVEFFPAASAAIVALGTLVVIITGLTSVPVEVSEIINMEDCVRKTNM